MWVLMSEVFWLPVCQGQYMVYRIFSVYGNGNLKVSDINEY
jgi:hypothetical protein